MVWTHALAGVEGRAFVAEERAKNEAAAGGKCERQARRMRMAARAHAGDSRAFAALTATAEQRVASREEAMANLVHYGAGSVVYDQVFPHACRAADCRTESRYTDFPGEVTRAR